MVDLQKRQVEKRLVEDGQDGQPITKSNSQVQIEGVTVEDQADKLNV